ncbi:MULTISPECIES: glycosyltransferase family 2 protein [Butyricimonas]|uniref:glycosyltransferase family 2 protein n=1 Tax=Butyricimonas TaxID=574697 RepID=UPI001D05EAA9|nr:MULTISPECIES: glycosyltransferase family 2 protein [Butyricimonas]MCB6974212.1 glycosyltransferase [Butyricimonas synergistica]MCG4520991.1 glycosyltransferase [Butyricimonas sp. DFI.6.44]
MDNCLFLSIIIPVYNLEDYIIPCVESIFSAKDIDKKLFEVIVVNDGSTDATHERVEEYIVAHPDFLIYLVEQDNQGVSAARNHGLSKARGEFVWFVDGDDAIACDALLQLSSVEYGKIDVIRIGNCVSKILVEDNSVITSYKSFANMRDGYYLPPYQLLGNEYEHGHMTYIWRRIFLVENNLNYPVCISYNEDYCLLVQALLLAKNAYVNLSFRFYLFREREWSVSRGKYDFVKLDKFLLDKLAVLEKLLRVKVEDIDKKKYWLDYLHRYVYMIILECCRKKAPFFLTLYCLGKLKKLQLYPMCFSVPQVSFSRMWLLNHSWLFICFCFMYRIWCKLTKK